MKYRLNIDIRKVIITLAVAIIILQLAGYYSDTLYYFLLGSVLMVIIVLVTFMLKYGFFFELGRFLDSDGEYTVKDYINLLDKERGFRVVTTPGGNYLSLLSRNMRSGKWALFDEIRIVLDRVVKQANIKEFNVLIVGGGVGAMAACLAIDNRCSQIVAIEKSESVVNVGKKYFLNLLSHKESEKIQFVNADAFTYIRKIDKKFNFILVDVSSGDVINPEIFQKSFLKAIKARLKRNALVTVNCGVYPDKSIYKKWPVYLQIFKNARLYYLPNRSFLGVVSDFIQESDAYDIGIRFY